MLKRKIVGGKIALLALLLILLFTACAPAALPANGTEDIPVYTFHTELQRAYLADKAGNVGGNRIWQKQDLTLESFF